MAQIVITGFEPFGKFGENPSGMIAGEITSLLGESVRGVVLPVEYGAARKRLIEVLDEERPGMCVCMGLAEGVTFRVEQLGRKPKEYADEAGEAVYQSRVPDVVREYVEGHGDFVMSEDCGQYVCEAVLWTLLDWCERQEDGPGGAFFLHVPSISEVWPLERIRGEVLLFFKEALKNK